MSWPSFLLASLQLVLLLARYMERARIISEADVMFTARLHLAAKEAIDDVTRDMDAAAARSDGMSNDPYERP